MISWLLYSLFLIPIYSLGLLTHAAVPIVAGILILAGLYYFKNDAQQIVAKFKAGPKRYFLLLLLLPTLNVLLQSAKLFNFKSCESFKSFTTAEFLLYLSIPFGFALGFLFFIIGIFATKRLFWWFWSTMLLNTFALIVISWSVNPMIRRSVMKSASIAGEPIIRAIEAYKVEQKKYPKNLEALVPKYLPKIPHTGMCAYPRFQYTSGGEPFSGQDYLNHTYLTAKSGGYMLFIETPRGGINWDRFFYWPSKKYSRWEYGGRVEKINGWAYTHVPGFLQGPPKKSDWPKIELIEAARQGNGQSIQALLKQGADIHADDQRAYGGTALHYAAKKGHLKVVNLLIKHGADINRGNWQYDRTPLIVAAKERQLPAVNLLLDHGADINAVEAFENYTALMVAVGNGHLAMVQTLLGKGADASVRDQSGRTVLHIGSTKSKPHQMIKMLLDHGADVNVNLQDVRGQTPLSIAAYRGHSSIVAMYLKLGANPNTKEKKKHNTPLHLVAAGGIHYAQFTKIMENLIRHGANVDAQNKEGTTPLMLSSQNGYKDLVNLLLANGAKVNLVNHAQESALSLAQKNNRTNVAKRLKQAGAR